MTKYNQFIFFGDVDLGRLETRVRSGKWKILSFIAKLPAPYTWVYKTQKRRRYRRKNKALLYFLNYSCPGGMFSPFCFCQLTHRYGGAVSEQLQRFIHKFLSVCVLSPETMRLFYFPQMDDTVHPRLRRRPFLHRPNQSEEWSGSVSPADRADWLLQIRRRRQQLGGDPAPRSNRLKWSHEENTAEPAWALLFGKGAAALVCAECGQLKIIGKQILLGNLPRVPVMIQWSFIRHAESWERCMTTAISQDHRRKK